MVHPVGGIYGKDGLGYVSVSKVLAETLAEFNPGKKQGIERWYAREPEAEQINERGQTRGTLVHSEIELFYKPYDFGEGPERTSFEQMLEYNIPAYMQYLHPLLKEVKSQNPADNHILIEEELFCRNGWAGTPDKRCWFEGVYTVWDWKSVRSYLETNYNPETKQREPVKKKKKYRSDYTEAFVQLGGYALGHNIEAKYNPRLQPINQGAVCVCYDWREPEVFLLNKGELKDAAMEFTERFRATMEKLDLVFPYQLQL